MDWQQIRRQYPHRWLVVEALAAATHESRRVVESLAVVEVFADDAQAAWAAYRALHHADPTREYYVLHTDRESLDIGVLDTFGRVSDR